MSTLEIPYHLADEVHRLVNDHNMTPEAAVAKAAANASVSTQAARDATKGAGDDQLDAKPKRSKYGAKRVTIDGHTFPSLAEGRRYEELKLMQQQGHIKHLTLQPRYQIRIDGVLITTYVADFRYQDVETGETVVEDVKGFKTPVYKLKRKLMQVVNGIEIQEIQA